MMILQVLGIVGSLIIFFAIGKLVGDNAPSLQQYGGEYFPFALVGLAVSDYFNAGLRSFSNRLRLAQTTGTLEAMLVTPVPGRWILACSGTWDLLLASTRLLLAVIIGIAFMGVSFSPRWVPLLLIAALSLLSFIALGLIAAALIMVIKRGDAVAALGNIFATVFAGALFPIDLLPGWIRWVAYVLPLHYALDGLRRAALVDTALTDLASNVVVLASFAAVLLPISFLSLNRAIARSRQDGSLGHY